MAVLTNNYDWYNDALKDLKVDYTLKKNILSFNNIFIDLQETLHGGQTFSWKYNNKTGKHHAVIDNRAVQVSYQNNNFIIENLNKENIQLKDVVFWTRYFALDFNYEQLKNIFSKDITLKKCIEARPFIRVLRQPFFDTLLSFIISQTNNIPRITGIVERLCTEFGKEIAPQMYAFPTPSKLAPLQLDALAPIRAGFRAKYLIDASKKIYYNEIEEQNLRSLPTPTARKELCTIYGVGPKVADCVLLFALQRTEVIPMDVWMKKAMQELFPNGLPTCTKGFEGIAQQYIFEWYRKNHPKK